MGLRIFSWIVITVESAIALFFLLIGTAFSFISVAAFFDLAGEYNSQNAIAACEDAATHNSTTPDDQAYMTSCMDGWMQVDTLFEMKPIMLVFLLIGVVVMWWCLSWILSIKDQILVTERYRYFKSAVKPRVE